MNTEQFLQLLDREGFPKPAEVHQPPNGSLGVHTHPFAVKALVIAGQIEIVFNEISTVYSAGDVFQLEFEQPHSESYGSAGVCYLASRKTK